MCVTRSGRMSGSVSGGCVESDVFERAMQILDSRKPEVVNYGIADELGFEVGLSCGGSIDVLIEPFVPRRRVGRPAPMRGAGSEPVVHAIGLAPAPLLGRKLTWPIEGEPVGSISPSLDSHIAEEGDQSSSKPGGRKWSPFPGKKSRHRSLSKRSFPHRAF